MVDGEGETPVPIPNTVVKPLCADGTTLETVWESRTLPGLIFEAHYLIIVGLFFNPLIVLLSQKGVSEEKIVFL